MIVLSEIWIYPVKSLPGIRQTSAIIDRRGLEWDRHWMLVNPDGDFVSQRQLPQMALFSVELENNQLRLGFPEKTEFSIGLNECSGDQTKVKIWDDHVNADLIGEEANLWFSDCLGVSVRLVKMPENEKRQVDQLYAEPEDQTGFSDGFPFLLFSQASLDDLNARIEDESQQMSVARFRPNLVIDGVSAYAEDHWQAIKIGTTTFRVVKPCSRCAITTVDPASGIKGSEPLLTLAKYRREGNKVFFGQNVIHDSAGVIHQGDLLSELE